MKKQYILWNSATDEFAKRSNKVVLHDGAQPPTWDNYPRRFPSNAGWRFEEVHETVVDPNHKGPPRFERRDSQVARFTKVIGPKANQR
jgi:hypothetical protein